MSHAKCLNQIEEISLRKWPGGEQGEEAMLHVEEVATIIEEEAADLSHLNQSPKKRNLQSKSLQPYLKQSSSSA